MAKRRFVMKRIMTVIAVTAVFSMIVAVPAPFAYWIFDGVPLCTTTGAQFWPTITADGAGGAIVVWEDTRSGNSEIYAQRVNGSGAAQWMLNGVALCNETTDGSKPTTIADGAGGAIVAWIDVRSGNYDVYAQRVNGSGAIQWAFEGVPICTSAGDQLCPVVTSDGVGGAIVTWYDTRDVSYGIYAQRIDASGIVQWTVNGIALCTATEDLWYPAITSDGAGGAIVTWYGARDGSCGIYAQRVNSSGIVQWTVDGVALCTEAWGQGLPTIASDGAGGAIVTWAGLRSGSGLDIYIQRVSASGAVQWTANGVPLCTAIEYQCSPQIISDEAGGAIVTWYDYRSVANSDIYAQRVNASGAVQWTVDGVALSTAAGEQFSPTITSDGQGGAIVTWNDCRSGSAGIYVQRVNTSGAVQWTADGVALSTSVGGQSSPAITPDGRGGAIVTWEDARSGNYDIYAQEIDSEGRVGMPPPAIPNILSVRDAPCDQGGWVRVTVEKSGFDSVLEHDYPLSMYNVWQRIDNPALLAMVTEGKTAGAGSVPKKEALFKHSLDASGVSRWPIKELNGRYFIQSRDLVAAGSFPPGTWELIGSFAACQQDQYIYRASTLADSTGSGISYSVYIVTAHTTDPCVWYASEPDSGYSVDNLPPGTPHGLAGQQKYSPAGLSLKWNRNTERDLGHYAVYRGLSETFVPEPSNLIAMPSDAASFDGGWSWSSGYCYKVSAIDIHGNESGFGLLRSEDVAGAGTPKTPEATYLAQNFPNPFNPLTRIGFGLDKPASISLRVYNADGRLVRTIAEGRRPAENCVEVWNGRDASGRVVASGVYFYRLDAGSFTQTRKMILLR